MSSTDREPIIEEHVVPDLPLSDESTSPIQNSVSSEIDGTLDAENKINLNVNWDSLDKKSIFEALRNFDDAQRTHVKVPGNRHDTYPLYEGEIATHSGEKLKLEIFKVISPNYHELQLGILRPSVAHSNPLHYVASFDFLQLREESSEEWDMKHRHTTKAYQGQGIAGKTLELSEEIFQQRSNDNGLSQSVSAKSGQKDLTSWLEKRNFEPATQQDTVMLERLKSEDQDLQEVEVKDGNYAGEIYVFDAKEFKSRFPNLSGPEDPAVWNFDNYGKPFFYMQSCFKIKMKKDLS